MVMIMGALSESLAVLGVVSESLAFLGSRLGALGRQARVAGLARLARPLVVIVVGCEGDAAAAPRYSKNTLLLLGAVLPQGGLCISVQAAPKYRSKTHRLLGSKSSP